MANFKARVKYKTICKLTGGEKVEYDLCTDSYNSPYTGDMDYLGRGVVFSVGGVEEESKQRMHFWKKRDWSKESMEQQNIKQVKVSFPVANKMHDFNVTLVDGNLLHANHSITNDSILWSDELVAMVWLELGK